MVISVVSTDNTVAQRLLQQSGVDRRLYYGLFRSIRSVIGYAILKYIFLVVGNLRGELHRLGVFQYGLCAIRKSGPARNNTDRYSVLFMRKQGKAVPRVERA